MSHMSVDDALKKIYDQDFGIRITAFSTLREANTPEVRQALIKAAQGTNRLTRYDAIRALYEIGGDDLLPVFIGLLGAAGHHTNRAVAHAIAQYGSQAEPLLVPALSSSEARVRLNAAQTFIVLGKYDVAVPVLLSLIFVGDPTQWPWHDTDDIDIDLLLDIIPPLREGIADKEGRDKLLTLCIAGLTDPDRSTQEGAAWCVWNEHGYSGEQPLCGRPDYITEASLSYWPRKTIPSEEYLQALPAEIQKAISDNMADIVLYSEYWQPRRAAAWILSRVGIYANPAKLLPALHDPYHEVGWMAARALQKATWDDPARVSLRGLLEDEDSTVRWMSVWLIGRLGDQGAVQTLGTLARTDSSPQVQMQAVYALGQIGDRSSLTILRNILANDSGDLIERLAGYSISQIVDGKKENDQIQAAIRSLEYGETIAERINAVITMQHLKDLAAFPALLGGLRDDAMNVREAVNEALEEIRHPIAVLPLVEAIRWEEPVFLRWYSGSDERYEDVGIGLEAAVEQTIQSTTSEIAGLEDKLEEALGDFDTRHHFSVAQIKVAMLGDSVEALIDHLQNEHYEVRYAAAHRLGELSEPSAVPHLARLLNEDGGFNYIRALCNIRTPAAFQAIALFILRKPSIWHPEAVHYLERMGQEPIDILKETLQSSDDELRQAALVTLMKLRAFDDREVVLAALQGDDTAKLAASEQIAAWGDESLVPALIGAMDGADDKTQGEILLSIGKIGSAEHIPYLAKLIKTGSKHIQTRAMFAIAEIGGEPALAALTSVLDHENFFTRQHSISLLGKAGGSAAIPLLSRLVVEEERQLSSAAADVLLQMRTQEAQAAREEALKLRESRKDRP